MLTIVLFLIIHHFTSLFVQTFFQHRYAAHQLFTMSKGWEKFFFVLTWITQGSSYLSPSTYGRMHRMHHAFADTEKDVHSPKNDPTILKMMLKTKYWYMGIFRGEIIVEDRFLGNLPEWRSFDVFAHGMRSRIVWGFLYLLFYLYFAPSYWLLFLLPIHFFMGPIHGVVINWFSHKFGYRNHKTQDTSTNLFPVEILMMGEGLHNNHHHSATNPNFAQKWFEIDPTYLSMWFMDKLNIIQLKK